MNTVQATIWVLLLTLSFSSTSSSVPVECKSALKLSLTTDWFPYVNRMQDDSTSGIDVELLKTILAKMGCRLDIVHFPERRSLFELSWGHFDIGLGASKTKDREQHFYFSLPYRIEQNRFAFRRGESDISTATTLTDIVNQKKLIGINLAGWYGDELERAKQEYNGFVFSDTAIKRLKMLLLKRVDIVIDDDVVLCSEIQKQNYQNIEIHPMLLSQADIHFIFNKGSVSKAFMAQFNQVLAETISSGELTSLFDQYVTTGCLPENRT